MSLVSTYCRQVMLPNGDPLPAENLRFPSPCSRMAALEMVNDWNRISSNMRASAPGSPMSIYWIEL